MAVASPYKATCNNRGGYSAWRPVVDEERCCIWADLYNPTLTTLQNRGRKQKTQHTNNYMRIIGEEGTLIKWGRCWKSCKGKFCIFHKKWGSECYPTQEVQRVGKRSSHLSTQGDVSSRFQHLWVTSTVAHTYMLVNSQNISTSPKCRVSASRI